MKHQCIDFAEPCGNCGEHMCSMCSPDHERRCREYDEPEYEEDDDDYDHDDE